MVRQSTYMRGSHALAHYLRAQGIGSTQGRVFDPPANKKNRYTRALSALASSFTVRF